MRDLVINPHAAGSAIEVRPEDNLRTAFARMRAADVSQLPVTQGERIVGLIDESDILALLTEHPGREGRVQPAGQGRHDRRALETISADAPIRELVPLFRKDYVAIVMDGERFLGLVTRIDLINHFRIALQ